MGLGQLRGPSWETGKPLNCPNQVSIVAQGGLEVCDAAHGMFVMKDGRSQIARSRASRGFNIGHPARGRAGRHAPIALVKIPPKQGLAKHPPEFK
jgi:hypothetical protein